MEEAWLAPEHDHHIAACIQVGACDGDLCAPRHGSPTGLQVCKSQGLHRKEEDRGMLGEVEETGSGLRQCPMPF